MNVNQKLSIDELYSQIKDKEYTLTKDFYLNPNDTSIGAFADKGDSARALFVNHKILDDEETDREIYFELGELDFVESYSIDDFNEYFIEKPTQE